MKNFNRKIILEDGSEYLGYGFGKETDSVCEIVFNTSMVGYQEIISDPSYTYQAVVMTYPLIGNYGITDDDFVSDYRMVNSVVSKGKFQHYGSIQKTDGMASQFGYTETYAVLNENKLTMVSGAFLSSDMMERQSFSQLMAKFAESVKF